MRYENGCCPNGSMMQTIFRTKLTYAHNAMQNKHVKTYCTNFIIPCFIKYHF